MSTITKKLSKESTKESTNHQINYNTEIFFWEEFSENNISDEEAERDTIKSILAEMRN